MEAENRLWNGAVTAQEEGRHEDAIRTLKRFLVVYPKSPRQGEGHWRLGQSLEQAGDLQAAVSEYQALLAMEPLLIPTDSLQVQATQRLDSLRREGVVFQHAMHGHTALLVSPVSVASLARPDVWLQKTRASGVTVLMLDVSCDATCADRVRAIPADEQGSDSGHAGLLFTTVHAPVVRPILNDLVPEAHRAGLSVVAVVDLLRAPWLDARSEWQLSVFDPRNRTVRPWNTLDVLNPSVNTHLTALLSDLTRADIDGLLIRTRSRNSFAYEIGEAAFAGFQAQYQETSADVMAALAKSAGSVQNTDSLSQPNVSITKEQAAGTLWHWVGWKARQELDALAQIRRALQQVRHGLRVILEVHSDAASEPLSALVNYGEDAAEASRRGFDILLNGPARLTDVEQMAALVKNAEAKALRRPVVGQPTTQQLWVLARGKGLNSRIEPGQLLQQADRVRVREEVNVLLVPDQGESLP